MASPQDMRAYLATLDADLTYVWSQSEVPLKVQYDLGQNFFNTLRKFGSLEDDRAKVRQAVSTDLGLDPTAQPPAGPQARVALAAVVSAWEIAREQIQREVQLRAESKALNLQRPISSTDRTAMKKALELRHGRKAAHEIPSHDYISVKTEEVENGDPRASQLDEITSSEDHEEHTLSAVVDISGGLKIVKKRQKASQPMGPEAFRSRLKIECHTWLMLSMKHPNIAYLQGLERDTWTDYVEFFLGRKVWMMEIPSSVDLSTKVSIPWQVLINFEFSCRKLAFRLVREEGFTLDAALKACIKDAENKEVNFTSPIALSGNKRKREPNEENADADIWKESGRSGKGKKDKGKGGKGGKGKGGKGAGKNQGKVTRKKWLVITPDGRQICFAFNKPRGCSNASCDRVHICQYPGCGGAHSVTACPKRGAAAAEPAED